MASWSNIRAKTSEHLLLGDCFPEEDVELLAQFDTRRLVNISGIEDVVAASIFNEWASNGRTLYVLVRPSAQEWAVRSLDKLEQLRHMEHVELLFEAEDGNVDGWENIRGETGSLLLKGNHILDVKAKRKRRRLLEEERKATEEEIQRLSAERKTMEEGIVKLLARFNTRQLVKVSGVADVIAISMFNKSVSDGRTLKAAIDPNEREWLAHSSIIEPLKRMEHVEFLIWDDED